MTNNLLFMVDTSGSMYRNKIAAVNATIAECIGMIRKRKSENTEFRVFYSSFDEVAKPIYKINNVMDEDLPKFAVEDANGFYKLTRFSVLYDGLQSFFENWSFDDENLMIILITDGKAVDSMNYDNKLNRIKNNAAFRNAVRIVAHVDGDVSSSTLDLFEFVDNKANRICKLSKLANEMDSLLCDGSNGLNTDNIVYNEIFG